ncbi:MAG: ParA family protein [Epsilonproteobacteria bacterium]|nr:ParA family protein [Campylobacterota bacterium]
MEGNQIFNTIEEIKATLEVNEKRAVELLSKELVPCITTGTEKRTRYYTTTNMIGHTKKYIEIKMGEKDIPHTNRDIFLKEPIDEMMDEAITDPAVVITVTNQKGGVSKTTNTVTIATALAMLGQRVLVVDLDPQAQSSTYFNDDSFIGRSIMLLFREYDMNKDNITKELVESVIHTEEGISINGKFSIDILPSELRLGRTMEAIARNFGSHKALSLILDQVKNEYDFIIIDTPPSPGLPLISSMYATDKVVLSAKPTQKSLEGLEMTIEEIKDFNREVEKETQMDAIFINEFNPILNHHHRLLEESVGHSRKIGIPEEREFVSKLAPTIFETSQEAKVSILDYLEKPKDTLAAFDPFFRYASYLVLERVEKAEAEKSMKKGA